jgi:hypothetical protein
MADDNSTDSHEVVKQEEEKPKIDPEAEAVKPELTPAQQQAQAFPEGGRDAWLAVAGSSACLFVSFGWVNCVSIFEEYYQTHQLSAYTPSEVAWIPSLMCKTKEPTPSLLLSPSANNIPRSIFHVLCWVAGWQNVR